MYDGRLHGVGVVPHRAGARAGDRVRIGRTALPDPNQERRHCHVRASTHAGSRLFDHSSGRIERIESALERTAPGYWAVTEIDGGAISGYCATGREK